MPSISPFDYAVIVIALLLSFRTAISGWLHGLLVGKGDKHQLHSEIHGILLAVTTQAANTAQIRDTLTQLVVNIEKPNEEWSVAIDSLLTIKDNLAALFDVDESVDLPGISIDRIARISERTSATVEKIEESLRHICGPVGHDGISRFEKVSYAVEKMSVNPTNHEDFHGAVLKSIAHQLDATKRLDERLFEFVNSTKRIMHALEGGVGSDDDAVIEAARDIRTRAADKGIELTLEQALKRAREQANFR